MTWPSQASCSISRKVEAAWVVDQWGELFDRRKNYGWPPIEYADRSDLVSQLISLRVRGYCVMGSCGLDGFALATGVEYWTRPRQADV